MLSEMFTVYLHSTVAIDFLPWYAASQLQVIFGNSEI